MSKAKIITILKVVITLLVVGFSIYFSIWKVDFAELGKSFRTANYFIALSIVPIILLSHYARAVRWKLILRYIHPNVRTSNLFSGVMIGYFMNNLIPRSGEVIRPYTTAQVEKETTFSSLLGSIVVERFIDTVALLVMIAGLLLLNDQLFDGFEDMGVDQDIIKPILYMAILLGVVFIVIAPSKLGLWLAEFFTRPLKALATATGFARLDAIREKILDIFKSLQLGFGALKSSGQIAMVVAWTVGIYILYMLPLYIMFFAFPSGTAGTPSLLNATEIWALTALAYAVAPTPGAFGVFHITARIALMKIVNFSYADAVAYATIIHFINYMVPLLLGGYYLVANNLSPKELLKAKSQQ